MSTLGKINVTKIAVAAFGAAMGFVAVDYQAGPAYAQGLVDPKPMSYQVTGSPTGNAVDGINATIGVLGGTLDGTGNGMGLLSVSTSVFSSFGIQGDLAYGLYDGNRASESAAAALHIFWRNPGSGMIGVYGDWGYLSPVHSGRFGIEAAIYSGQWTIEGLIGVEFGQNVYATYFDEVDVSYYVDDNTRISLGHRFSSRGNIVNIGFEKQFGDMVGSAWSVFGEAEAGEDDYYQVFAGLRASLGSGSSATLMGRDRNNGVRIRIPRNLASVTQCAGVDNPFPTPQWLTNLGLIDNGSMTETLCGSKASLNRVSSTGIFKP